MESWKNIKLDEESMWPKTGLVELDPAHSDERGAIQSEFPYEESITYLFQERSGALKPLPSD